MAIIRIYTALRKMLDFNSASAIVHQFRKIVPLNSASYLQNTQRKPVCNDAYYDDDGYSDVFRPVIRSKFNLVAGDIACKTLYGVLSVGLKCAEGAEWVRHRLPSISKAPKI